MKKILISIINIYQKLPLSSHGLCRFYPTCSEYAKESISMYGAIKGSLLTFKRLLKCRAYGPYGYDPVPVKENDK